MSNVVSNIIKLQLINNLIDQIQINQNKDERVCSCYLYAAIRTM